MLLKYFKISLASKKFKNWTEIIWRRQEIWLKTLFPYRIFDQGRITWTRIVTLLSFGYRMGMTLFRQSVSGFVSLVVQLVTRYILLDPIRKWIVQSGGWVRFFHQKKNFWTGLVVFFFLLKQQVYFFQFAALTSRLTSDDDFRNQFCYYYFWGVAAVAVTSIVCRHFFGGGQWYGSNFDYDSM